MENPKHPNHQQACSTGGRISAAKVYYCSTCDKVGAGHKMVHAHLRNECGGKASATLLRSDKKNRHRIEEAQINTAIWVRQEQLRIETEAYEAVKRSIIDSIEEIRKLGLQAIEDEINIY